MIVYKYIAKVLQYKKILLFVSIVALLVLLFFVTTIITVTQYPEADTIGKNVTTFSDLENRFEDLSNKKGGVYGYEILRRAVLPPQTDLHLLGHIVGGVLYSQKGIDGIQSCTADFRNACSHSIVIGALAEFGTGAVPLIRDACKKAPGGSGAYTMCFHGLGHGVFAGYGYDLPKTIAFCKLTGTKEYNNLEYTECFGGAIMELTGGGGHSRNLWKKARKKYLTSPLNPCMSSVVPPELKAMCLNYLTPEMWVRAGISLANPNTNLFWKAFKYCEAIPKSDIPLQDACYEGFGKEFVPLVVGHDVRLINTIKNQQLKNVYAWCLEAGTKDGITSCLTAALESLFWGGENDPKPSFAFCSEVKYFDKEEGGTCFNSLAKIINRYILDTKKHTMLCNELPTGAKTICSANR